MATNTHTRSGAAVSIVALLAALVAATAQHATTHTERLGNELDSDEIGLMGFAGHVPDSKKPKLTAYFEQESYRPGDRAELVRLPDVRHLDIRLPGDDLAHGPLHPLQGTENRGARVNRDRD